MADFTLPYENLSVDEGSHVRIASFEDGTEQRVLSTPMPTIKYAMQSPNLTAAQFQVYLSFWRGKKGAYDLFTWLEPFTEQEITVRFVPDSFKYDFKNSIYVCKWAFIYRGDPIL